MSARWAYSGAGGPADPGPEPKANSSKTTDFQIKIGSEEPVESGLFDRCKRAT